jgi:hypothetical protein
MNFLDRLMPRSSGFTKSAAVVFDIYNKGNKIVKYLKKCDMQISALYNFSSKNSHKPFYAAFFLNAFLVVGWLVSIAHFVKLQYSEKMGYVFGFYGLFAYPVMLFFAVLFYAANNKNNIFSIYIKILFFAVIIFFLYGLLSGNYYRIIAFDVIVFFTLLSSIIIGSCDKAWKDLVPVVLLLSATSVFMAIYNCDTKILQDRTILNLQPGSYFEASLYLIPIIFFFNALKNNHYLWILSGLLTVGAHFVYMYFGRRGTTVECFIYLIFGFIIIPYILKNKRRFVLGMFVIAITILAYIKWFPFDVLMARYQGYELAAVPAVPAVNKIFSTLVSGNQRWREIDYLFSESNSKDLLFGRGLGGVFLLNKNTEFGFDSIDSNRFGRITTHAFIGMILLKGGLILFAILFVPIFIIIYKSFYSNEKCIEAKLIACLCVFFILFASMQNGPTYSTPWTTFAIGIFFSKILNIKINDKT